ncbi:hypothetical protein [Bathymodiolus japonicus methanotrophic gill symbiont]|uniref:hypothetical protein n=1 Tax=Bathymodiolus japonicus methanotrophic gill symbiont TaxID=113269 RepID=UPI001C8E4CB3|nr:hypothetical protein [Bathymodiolus japonicus methanotrophic gill symbiont]
MATSNGSTAIRDKILASLARYRALRIGKFPCAFWRLSARPGLTAGVAIFAKACFGHPSPSKQQKLNATTYASGGPDSSSSPRPDPTRGRNIGSK